MTRRWLQSADVEIDDATGALLVKIGDVDLKIDMAETDVEAIVAGIAGTPDGKTLKDVVAALAAVANIPADPAKESGKLTDIAGYVTPLTLKGLATVTVDSTANGKTLAALLGGTLDTSLKRLELLPETVGICYAIGDASSSSTSLEDHGKVLAIQKAEADALKFYAAVNTKMTVFQFG